MYSIAPILVAFYFIFIGSFVLQQNRNNELTRVLFLLCLTTFGWQFCFSLMFQIHDYQKSFTIAKVGWTFILFLPTSIYHFLILLSEKRGELKMVYLSYIFSALLLFPLWFSNQFISGLHIYFWGYYPKGAFFEPFHIIQTIVVALRGIWVVYKNRVDDNKVKLDLRKYSLIGSLIYTTAAFDYIPNYFTVEIYPYGCVAIAIGLTVISYSLVKNKLLDINLATSLIISRLATYLIFFIIFIFCHFVLAGSFLPPSKSLFLFILLFLTFACETYVLIKQKIQKLSDRFLVKERTNYHKLVNIINENLEVVTSLDDLFRFIKYFIPEAFDAKLTHLYIKDDFFDEGNVKNEYHLFGDEKTSIVLSDDFVSTVIKFRSYIGGSDLRKEGIANSSDNSVLVPFIVSGRMIGFILITPNNPPFSYWQNEAFGILISQAGMALDRIKAYRKIHLQKEEFLKQKIDLTRSLAGSIAHEMRNPLNAINLSLSEISEAISSNDLRKIDEYKSISQNSIKRANQVINIILAELRDKKLDPKDFTNFSAKDLLNKVIAEYGYNCPEEKNRIKLNIKNDFIIKADETLLIYVFFNLIKNALYYPESQVTISTEPDQLGNQITIYDNGPGISKEKLETLFKDFETSGKKGGTGLGLTFCKRTMISFGGDINCESKEGKYTQFTLKFPMINEPETIHHQAKPITKDFSKLKDKKILLVDDQLTNRLLTARYLSKHKIQIDQAQNGQEALEKAKETTYDLILMDIEMPILNGIEATKQIKSLPNNHHTPIIAITGDDNGERLQEILDSGFDNYMTKGQNYENLITLIKTLINL